MYATAQKEEFSFAYVHAVASVAGFNVGTWRVDNDSVDVTLKAKGLVGSTRSPHLDIQLKCTQNLTGDEAEWSFELKRKNYEDLTATDLHVPRILVVLEVPDDVGRWIEHGENDMTLYHRAYWSWLIGQPALPDEQKSKTVRVPRENVFDVDGLNAVVGLVHGEG
jgi:hypothetical protein